jgi:glycosyltransferase involved in cell wall biosynthesis
MKTALLHHWLNGMRGGEKVFEIFCDLFPDSDIFTLFYEKARISERINKHSIVASGLNRFSLLRKNYTNMFMFFPFVTEQFDVTGYELIISSDTISVKGVITSPESCHICYCHTPPRYVWDRYFEYLDNAGLGRLKKQLARIFLHTYRQWDAVAANRVDYFIANSNYVAKRIAKAYRRKAVVANPPINLHQFSISEPEDFYLTLGQLVPYKRVDLLIDAFNEMPDKKLAIVGSGPLEKTLRKKAGRNIEFTGWADEEQKVRYFQKCQALLFPGIEDYGITPLEVQACGRPVIAFGRGGVLDTVRGIPSNECASFDPEKNTGVFFQSQTADSIIHAIKVFESHVVSQIDPLAIRKHAEKFDEKQFSSRISTLIDEMTQDFNKNGPPVYR